VAGGSSPGGGQLLACHAVTGSPKPKLKVQWSGVKEAETGFKQLRALALPVQDQHLAVAF